MAGENPINEGQNSGVPIYDISGAQPVLGNINPEDVEQAVTSGQYSLPKGHNIPVISPDGEPGYIDAAEAPVAFSQGGYKYATPEALNNLKYGTGTQQAIAGLEGAAQGVLGPLAPAAEEAIGIDPEDIRGREKANPWTHGIGQGVGLAGSLGAGFGAGALLGKAGEAVVGGLGLAGKASNLGKIGAAAIDSATQMGLLQMGDEVSHFIEHDPDQSAQTAIADIGLSSLLGAGGGAAFGAISPLWKATNGDKLVRYIEDFKSQLGTRLANPNPAEALTNELSEYYHTITSAADEVYGPKGLKSREIASLVPEMNNKIQVQTQNLSNNLNEALMGLKDDPYVGKLQKAVHKWEGSITSPDITSPEVFNATQELKQQLQEWGKFNKNIVPLAERDFRDTSKKLGFEIRTALEDSDVWGKAADRQQAINSAFKEYLPALQDFEKKFTSKMSDGSRVIDPGKINTYVNQLGKPNAELKQDMLDHFMKASENYKNVIEKSHANLGLDSPFQPTSLNQAQQTLKKLSPGAKAANVIIDRALSPLAGKTAGAAVGAGVGHYAGSPLLGALIGEHVLGNVFSSVIPGIIKPILEKAASAEGFQSAIKLGQSIAKGERLLGSGVKAVFKSEAQILPKTLVVPLKAKENIDERIQELSEKPEEFANIGGHSGYYMPDHGSALSASATRAVNYLNSLRPSTDKLGVLNGKRTPSDIETSQYNRALMIAEKPVSILQHIKDGTITSKDLQALNTMYPGIHQRMSQKLLDEMNTHISKGNMIPYKTRLGLSLFMGQNLDKSLTPVNIQMSQMSQGPSQSQQPQMSPKQPRGSKSSLNKMPGLDMLPNQAREAKRASIS